MDPSQRLALELSYEALENGMDPHQPPRIPSADHPQLASRLRP